MPYNSPFMQQNQPYDAFLSHNSKDKSAVEALARKLTDYADLKVWLDKWNLVPGDPWQEVIEEALAQSRTCVVFLGPSGFGTWHHEEMRNALDQRISQYNKTYRVIPVLLPNALMPERSKLPSFLSRLTWVDFRDGGLDSEEAFQRLVAGIRGVAPGRPDSSSGLVVTCPYRGLEVFEEIHARFFFGREAMMQHLVEVLRQTCFLGVLGPSGSGKSSLIRAGLLPELRAGALPSSESWKYVTFKPGYRPLETLATSLVSENISDDPLEDLIHKLATKENALHLQVRLGLTKQFSEAEREKVRCFILVDQFEEVFTHCQNEKERLQFIENLRYAGFIEGGHTVIVLTMRADFLSKAAEYTSLAEIISDHQFLVSPLDETDLHRVIEEPASAVGLQFEAGLIPRILHDAGNEPGTLPLLEDSLLQLYEYREGRLLTQQAYDLIGGVQGALAKRAENLYSNFTSTQQGIARRILLRLTQPGEGTADTRRRAAKSELLSTTKELKAAEQVIEALTKARLLTISKIADESEQVDVAHEALIRGWPRLSGWVNEDRTGLRLHRRLTEASIEWQREGRVVDFLYRGAKLTQLVEWQLNHELALNELEHEFLNTSVLQKKREEEDEKERQKRDLETAQKVAETQRQRAEVERKSRVRLVWFSIALVMLLAGTTLLAYFAFQQRNLANQQRNRADENAKRVALFLYVANMNLAKNAFDEKRWARGDELLEEYIPQSGTLQQDDLREFYWRYLWRQNHNEIMTLKGDSSGGASVAFVGDGKTLASGNFDGAIKLWDLKNGKEIKTFDGLSELSESVDSIAVSPDGKKLAGSSIDGMVKVWDVMTGQELAKFDVAGITVTEDASSIATFSPDLRTLANTVVVIDNEPTQEIDLWDVSSGRKKATLRAHTENIYSIAFSFDGKMLASGSGDKLVKVWEVSSGREFKTFKGHKDNVRSVGFSPDGKTLASGDANGTVKLWDVRSGKELVTLNGHSGFVRYIAFSPDGKILASGSDDGTIQLWVVPSGHSLKTLRGHIAAIASVAFSPDGATVAGGSSDGTVMLWDVQDVEESIVLKDQIQGLTPIVLSPDGKLIATGGEGGTINLWNVTSQQEIATLRGHGQPISDVVFSPDGGMLASFEAAGLNDELAIHLIKVWDVQNGREIITLKSYSVPITSLALSLDGSMLASGNKDGTIKLWEIRSGRELMMLKGHTKYIESVAFHPDGRTLVSVGDDKTIKVWNVQNGQEIITFNYPAREIYATAISLDGEKLATSGDDGTIRLWDVRSGKEILQLKGHENSVYLITFSPDGRTLVSKSNDGTSSTIKLWDVRIGQELTTFKEDNKNIKSMQFIRDGSALLYVTENGLIRFYYAAAENDVLKTCCMLGLD